MHVSCDSGKKCLRPGALALLLCSGTERAHVAPGYGLMATMRPEEVGVESSRETVHGNAREAEVSLTGAGWGRRCVGLFEDWQVECGLKRKAE